MKVFTYSLSCVLWRIAETDFYSYNPFTILKALHLIEEKEMKFAWEMERREELVLFRGTWTDDKSPIGNFVVRFVHNNKIVETIFSRNRTYATLLLDEFEQLMEFEKDGHALMIQFVLLDQVDQPSKEATEIEIPKKEVT